MGLSINENIGLKDESVWDSYVVCFLYDMERYQYYGMGRFPIKHILEKARKKEKSKNDQEAKMLGNKILQMGLHKNE